MVTKIGIIAEDDSDIKVIGALIEKYKKPNTFRCSSFVGRGCGKLRKKILPWAENLAQRGCTRLIVVHDLDDRVLADLSSTLSAELNPSPILKHLIVIPIRELEAWLLADHLAIKKALKIKGVTKAVPSPESISRPKEHLRDVIFKWSEKRVQYTNTVHNEKIAKECQVENLKKCSSFASFDKFVSTEC